MPALLPENTSPDLRSSSLAPKEPYHIPGYAGHKPQYKYQCSETFGNCTHRLLLSPEVNQSSNSVLRPIDPPPRSQTVPLGFHDVPKLNPEDYAIHDLLAKRRERVGDQLFKPNMRSGYMGFVPKAHFSSYHAKSFPDLCNEALRDFNADQARHQAKLQQLSKALRFQQTDSLTSSERQMLGTRHSLPLRSLRNNFPPFVSKDACQRHESPYFLSNDHPMKSFKSGFAGHVPFYKDLGGHGFPVVTNQALKEFSQERERQIGSLDKPLPPGTMIQPRPPKKTPTFSSPQRNRIFLIDSGIIPRYAGYVPGTYFQSTSKVVSFIKLVQVCAESGQKFRFGHTFADGTKNPLNVKPSEAPAITATS